VQKLLLLQGVRFLSMAWIACGSLRMTAQTAWSLLRPRFSMS